MDRIKLILADDHKILREGLANLLSDDEGIIIVAQADNGKDVIEKAKQFRPDIVIMDIGMPIMNGMEATRILKEEMPDVNVIALSMHSDKQFVRGMLMAGAKAYVLKNSAYNELIEAIHSVYGGKIYLSKDITNLVVQDYLDNVDDLTKIESDLSDRELEVLKLVAEGKSTKEIADLLFISVKTVGTHKLNIQDKLGLKSNADIVKYAIKNGLISLD